jgi:hypothetical protein
VREVTSYVAKLTVQQQSVIIERQILVRRLQVIHIKYVAYVHTCSLCRRGQLYYHRLGNTDAAFKRCHRPEHSERSCIDTRVKSLSCSGSCLQQHCRLSCPEILALLHSSCCTCASVYAAQSRLFLHVQSMVLVLAWVCLVCTQQTPCAL